MRRCVALLLMLPAVTISGARVVRVDPTVVQERMNLFGGDDAKREASLKSPSSRRDAPERC